MIFFVNVGEHCLLPYYSTCTETALKLYIIHGLILDNLAFYKLESKLQFKN